MHKDLAISWIKKHEGFRSRPYRDTTGNMTIGYGTNLTEWSRTGISERVAEAILIAYLADIEAELSKRLSFYDNLPPKAKAILLDMAYNLGVPSLLTFQKMLSALSAGNYSLAAKEMLNSRWASQVKTRATFLAAEMESIEP